MNIVPKLSDLLEQPERLSALPPEAVPAMIGELERIKAILWARLTVAQNGNGPGEPEKDTLLTAEQTAPILGVTPRWLYRHAKKLPFARRLSRKVLRFSEMGARKWQAGKRAC